MTKKLIPQWAEPHDTRSHLAFAVGTEFAQKLRAAIDKAGLTPSDLARKIWGDAPPTAAGYVSAKNRDRISKYLAGKVIPDANTLKLLAEHLNVPEESLAPQVVGSRLEREHPEVRLTVIAGRRDRVHLTINSAMSLSKALRMIAVLEEDDDEQPGSLELREGEPPRNELRSLKRALREQSKPMNELSVKVLKHALQAVETKLGSAPKLNPRQMEVLHKEIVEALAHEREKTRKDRESIYMSERDNLVDEDTFSALR